MPDIDQPLFHVGQFRFGRIECLLNVVVEIEKHRRLSRVRGYPIESRRQQQPLLVCLRVFQKLCFVGGRRFGKKRCNRGVLFLDLMFNTLEIIVRSFHGIFHTAQFLCELRQLFQIRNTHCNVFRSNFRFSRFQFSASMPLPSFLDLADFFTQIRRRSTQSEVSREGGISA